MKNYDEPEIDVESLVPQSDEDIKRHKDMMAELEYLSGDQFVTDHPEAQSASYISTSVFNSRSKKKKKEKAEEQSVGGQRDWFTEFVEETEQIGKRKYTKRDVTSDLDDILGRKKKKKKKKKKGEPTDFKKEFETEKALFSNILRDTSRFVDSLQREYDSLSSRKATGRGMTKNTQDLISNINSARSLQKDLVKELGNIKKLAIELSMKERKELGLDGSEGTSLGEYGSAYLKKLLDERSVLFRGGSEEIVDATEEDVGEFLDEFTSRPVTEEEEVMYGKNDRTEEADLYLKYENLQPKIYVEINRADPTDYEYVAKSELTGEELPDYPLPLGDIASLNSSTGIATDDLGQKYPIIWV